MLSGTTRMGTLSRGLLAVSLLIAAPNPAFPQTEATPSTATATAAASAIDGGTPTFIREETQEERMRRLGTPEDPGLDPDPAKEWWRFGKRYTIGKYERRWAAYDQDAGFVRPFGFANVARELYQQNEKWVWVWEEVKTDADRKKELEDLLAREAAEKQTKNSAQLEYLESMRSEFQTLEPPDSGKTVRFEESSNGLPTTGSWRNSAAIADMNGDGHLDIVTPPERGGGNGAPAIFLGDGKGNWKFWDALIWPYGVQYGGVGVADFNKDGHMDIAFAVHLQGVRVMLGDGKGKFVDASEGLGDEPYPTRRLVVADVDLDGYTDILSITEGPVLKELKGRSYGKVRAYLNRDAGKRWEVKDASDPKNVFGGDWLALGKFNSDRVPDFVGASIYFQGSQIVHLSTGKAQWKTIDTTRGDVVPFLGYYFAVGAGRFSSSTLDDAILSYARFWPEEVAKGVLPTPPVPKINGLDRITFKGSTPKRTPIIRWAGDGAITGLAKGDFDGDGKLDLILSSSEPRQFLLLLGDGKGGFKRAAIEGMTAMTNTNYDISVADVNGDKRPDVIVLYESGAGNMAAATAARASSTNDGSIRVFLNRGLASPEVATK